MRKLSALIISMVLLGLYANAQTPFTPVSSYRITAVEVHVNETVPALQDTTWEDGSVQTLVVQVANTPTQAEIDAYAAALDMSYVNQLLEFGASGEISFAGHVGTETRSASGTEAVWDFPNAECPSCAKTLQMLILSESATGIVYAMQDEDGNQKFRAKYVLVKI